MFEIAKIGWVTFLSLKMETWLNEQCWAVLSADLESVLKKFKISNSSGVILKKKKIQWKAVRYHHKQKRYEKKKRFI